MIVGSVRRNRVLVPGWELAVSMPRRLGGTSTYGVPSSIRFEYGFARLPYRVGRGSTSGSATA
jgi:hypothetical protein